MTIQHRQPLPEIADAISTLPQGEGGSFGGDDPRALTEKTPKKRGAGVLWRELYWAEGSADRVATALGIAKDDARDPWSEGMARFAGAMDLGLTITRIVAGESNARFRLAAREEAQAIEAFVLPVESDVIDFTARTLSLGKLGEEEIVEAASDLVAFALAGGRPWSLNGVSAAVGQFTADAQGSATLYANGRGWLDAHLAHWKEAAGEANALTVAAPESFSTLIVDAKDIEWRPHFLSCPLPRGLKQISVPDSQGLAALIRAAMRRKPKTPKLPEVVGP